MQIKFIIATIIISLVIASLAIYTSFLPKLVATEVEIEVDYSSDKIYKYLNNVENWGGWIVGSPKDIDKMQFSGKLEGEGAVLKWWSKKLGDGALELLNVSDSFVCYQMISDNNIFRQKGVVFWKENISGSKIIWRDTLDISTNLMGRWSAGENFSNSIKNANKKYLYLLNNNIQKIK